MTGSPDGGWLVALPVLTEHSEVLAVLLCCELPFGKALVENLSGPATFRRWQVVWLLWARRHVTPTALARDPYCQEYKQRDANQ
ncbi:UNVERIFIED_ORG: hypothetical protein J3D58_000680 [Paenarthrobacter nicotinovorans]|uniref:hypothetical protein n=1 Tax=Paenarthrobacter histidinolovorans TaxID=43664 RepID=UPI0016643815|nr:hypothetical protein [Paenarthrobacter histidinolovorans]